MPVVDATKTACHEAACSKAEPGLPGVPRELRQFLDAAGQTLEDLRTLFEMNPGKATAIVASVCALSLPVSADAASHHHQVPHDGLPVTMKGSKQAILEELNRLRAAGIPTVQDTAEMKTLIQAGTLVPIPEPPGIKVRDDLPPSRRFVRPQAAEFVAEVLAPAFHKHFPNDTLYITSAIRPKDVQAALRRQGDGVNATDPELTSHPGGLTFDFSRKNLGPAVRRWLGRFFLGLERKGTVQFTREKFVLNDHVQVNPNTYPSEVGTQGGKTALNSARDGVHRP